MNRIPEAGKEALHWRLVQQAPGDMEGIYGRLEK